MANANASPRQVIIDQAHSAVNTFDNTFKKQIDIFEYKYENVLPKGNYQKRFQSKNRKISSDRVDYQLPDNSIQTSKYTLINFLPKQLFEQFSKLANLYFLVIGFMQIIPQVSISNSVPVIFMPLFVIVVVSATKDIYEDYKRRTSDSEENNRKVLVLKPSGFQEIPWKDVRVGNIIKIEQDQCISADILLLRCSEPKVYPGICYVETKSLDGETNLKLKNVALDLLKYYCKDENIEDQLHQIILKYEAPNPYLNRFYGEVIDRNGGNYAVNFNNFLLRGCNLRNIRYIYGLVAYTGHDTKIMMNSFKARSKKSKLEMQMQKQILYIFIIQLTICISCGIYYLVWYEKNKERLEYLGIDLQGIVDTSPVYNFFVRIGNWILIFTQNIKFLLKKRNFVPISLLVTLEMVKFIQGFFISSDKKMREPTVQSSNLNEELGQIEHVFTDKTGTLTCNIMEFKKITIGTTAFGDVHIGQQNYIQDLSFYKQVSNVDFRDANLIEILNNPSKELHYQVKYNQSVIQIIRNCLFMIAVCHSIITDLKDGELIYNASSPDELALVNFARFCGVEFKGTDENNIITIEFQNTSYQYKLLEQFEFTSSRKRQSCLVQNCINNEIWLYTKGADTILMDQIRLSNKSDLNTIEKRDYLNANLQKYGEVGLRTLVLAQRKLTESEYKTWSSKYQQVSKKLDGREEMLQILQDDLEKELEIIGATAIEDKLQANVGSTIDAIKKAGIKVWVLTGDKIETAINIGYSCKLLQNEMIQHLIDEKEEAMIINRLDEILSELKEQGTTDIDQKEHALIISGDSLFHALKPAISSKVTQIGELCSVVLCCRVSPKQKQDVVSLVRKEVLTQQLIISPKKPLASTLAIGDGANDVNMITAAHVGIGVRGVEGQQAARASDYAVQEFQELRRLLFYHGRESYRRNSILVCYNFFKNILLVLPQFWYGTLSTFSAQSLYDSFIYQLFNILYASMPIIIYAVFDEEHDPDILVINQNNYYIQGVQNLLFNTKIFWGWVLNGIWQAAIICYFASFTNGNNFVSQNGYTSHVWANGTMVFGLVVLVSNFKIVIMSNTFTIITFIGIVGSLLTYLISWVIIDGIQSAEAYMVFLSQFLLILLYLRLWATPNFHLGNILTIVATTFFDLSLELYLKWNIRTTDKATEPIKSDDQLQSKSQFKGQSIVLGQSIAQKQKKGQFIKKNTAHTGFAFCHLERDQDPFKESHQI